jgi:hypothetical protein
MLKYKVYFDEETGMIFAIANRDQNFKTYFETDFEDVEDFITGKKSMPNYKVVYNINTSSYNIIERTSKIETLVDNLIYKITPREVFQVGIWQDNTNRCWTVALSNEQKSNLEQIKSRPNETLTFSITQRNNPNILYKTFACTLNDLVENNKVDFEYSSQDEESLTDYSVYTNRKFDKYTCGVIDVENQSH